MKYRIQRCLLVLIFIFLFINNVYASEFVVSSKEVLLYNLNDSSILYEENSDDMVQIASLTKIMTAIVALENIDDLDSCVTITSDVFKDIIEYSQAGFKLGWEVSYRDLLYGVMLPSGADAVNAIVINLGGYDKFVGLMNDKAKELKLNNTHFDNAIGMDSSDNYSTARDLATLLMYALDNEEFYKIFTTREYKIDKYNLTLDSTLLKYSTNTTIDVSNILGAKSGFTDAAGLCLASISKIDNVNYLLINLDADYTNGKSRAIKDAVTIYDYYSTNYGYKKVISKGQTVKTVKNKLGYDNIYDIYFNEDIYLYLDNDIDISELSFEYDGKEEINYKNKINDKLGIVTIKYGDEVMASYDVYLNDELKYYHPVIYILIFIVVIFILMLFRIIQIKIRKKRRRKNRKKRKR